MRARRIDTYYSASCNGAREGCAWNRAPVLDGFATKEAAQRHARQEGHEAVVTEQALVVYDMRPRR